MSLDHFRIEGGADFGVVGDDHVGSRLDFDSLGHLADFELDVGQGAVVALGEDDAVCLPRLEARSLDRNRVGARLNGGNEK